MNELSIFLAFILSLVSVLILVPAVIRFATVFGFLDQPDGGQVLNQTVGRRVHERPIPRLGGIAILGGFIVSYCFFQKNGSLAVLFGSSMIIFLVGLWDDIKPLPWFVRLAVQLSMASAVVIMCNLEIKAVSLSGTLNIELPYIAGLLMSIFMIVGAINATNMVDGLDGLAGGVVLVGFTFLTMLCFILNRDINLLAVFQFPIFGAILGFLRYNTHPASVFMGDGGSNWLGFMIGVMALFALQGTVLSEQGQLIHTSAADINKAPMLISVLMCFAVPICDTACVIINRIRKGLKPVVPDKSHFHHTLLRLGLSHAQCVMAIYFVAIICALTGLVPVAFPGPKYMFNWLPYVSGIGLSVIIFLGMSTETKFLERLRYSRVLISRNHLLGNQFRVLLRYWELVNRYVVYFILAILPFFAGVVSQRVGYFAGIASLALLGSIIFPSKKSDFIEMLILSFAVGILLFANNQNAISLILLGKQYNVHFLYNYLFIFLFFSVLAFLFVTMRKRYLMISPSDFLVIFLPLVLFLLPAEIADRYRINIVALRCLVFFGVLRSFAKRRRDSIHNTKMLALFGLILVFATSVLGLRVVY